MASRTLRACRMIWWVSSKSTTAGAWIADDVGRHQRVVGDAEHLL